MLVRIIILITLLWLPEIVFSQNIVLNDSVKVAYSIKVTKTSPVFKSKYSLLKFNLHHVVTDSAHDIKKVMHSMVRLNGIQPAVFYNEEEIKFSLPPTDKLEILIRPFWHYYFQVDNLKIEVDKDYEIDIWFRLFEDIMIEPDSLRYVKPLRIYTNYNDHEG